MSKTNGFEVVDRAEVPSVRPGPGRRPTAINLALEAGQTVWTSDPNAGRAAHSKTGYLRKKGLIVRQRQAERNGATGWYLWAEARS